MSTACPLWGHERTFTPLKLNVRFTPQSGHSPERVQCPLKGHKQTSPTYSITSSAPAMSVSTLKPSAFKPWQTRCELSFRDGHAWLAFDIRAVASKTAVCSSPETCCNKDR